MNSEAENDGKSTFMNLTSMLYLLFICASVDLETEFDFEEGNI